MSEFKISCPNCQQHVLCDESYRGIQFACPTCGATIAGPPAVGSPPPSRLKLARSAPGMAARREMRPHIPRSPKEHSRRAGKSWLTTLTLALFLGGLGIDRFYNGRTGLGIGKLLTVGACGLWTMLDVLLLLCKRYRDAHGNYLQPAKRSHLIVGWSVAGAAILVSMVAVHSDFQKFKSQLANLESIGGPSGSGFPSPEAVFEAMKANPNNLLLLLPQERYDLAFINVAACRALVATQTDKRKQQESEQALRELIRKYHLTDKLELNTMGTVQQDKSMVASAFANVDLAAFVADLSAFGKKYSTGHFSFSTSEDRARPVSLQGLKIAGDEARATVHYADQTEKPVVFVKSGNRWFMSAERAELIGGGLTVGVSEQLSLVVTFDSVASMKRATAQRLLQGVAYDRSKRPKLAPAGTAHPEAILSFNVPPSSEQRTIIQTIRRSRGVTKVENLLSKEMKAQLAAKFEPMFKSATNSSSSAAGAAIR